MMLRLAVAAAIVALAAGIAWWLRRRRPAAPPRDAHPLPRQLDRRDFPAPHAPWLVAYFSSTTCDSCRGLGERVAALASAAVAVAEVEFKAQRALHSRYRISAIPMILVADHEGVVRHGFVGAPPTDELTTVVRSLVKPDPGA
jgi:hypothetical protein